MINVIYHRKYHRLSIEGHAYSGEAGHDLVCASASILAYTLAANVYNMAETKQARNEKHCFEEGRAEISCTPLARYDALLTLIFDSICAGFELLAKDFPDNISYEVRG